MFLEHLGQIFAEFKWQYILEIATVALVVYIVFYYSRKFNLSSYMLLLVVALAVIFVLALLDAVGTKIYIALFLLAVLTMTPSLFFVEMRREFFRLSSRLKKGRHKMTQAAIDHIQLAAAAENIVKACQNMSKSDVGALVVICDSLSDAILESGTAIDSMLSSELLETIFFPRSPLHDGAVIVSGDKIVAASCYLPLSTRTDLSKEFGTRHRAALGMSETNTEITAIVVSEESGIISAAHDGKILRYLDGVLLKEILLDALHLTDDQLKHNQIWGKTNENE